MNETPPKDVEARELSTIWEGVLALMYQDSIRDDDRVFIRPDWETDEEVMLPDTTYQMSLSVVLLTSDFQPESLIINLYRDEKHIQQAFVRASWQGGIPHVTDFSDRAMRTEAREVTSLNLSNYARHLVESKIMQDKPEAIRLPMQLFPAPKQSGHIN